MDPHVNTHGTPGAVRRMAAVVEGTPMVDKRTAMAAGRPESVAMVAALSAECLRLEATCVDTSMVEAAGTLVLERSAVL